MFLLMLKELDIHTKYKKNNNNCVLSAKMMYIIVKKYTTGGFQQLQEALNSSAFPAMYTDANVRETH